MYPQSKIIGVFLCLISPGVLFANSESSMQEENSFLKEELSLIQEQIEEINLNANDSINISGYTDIEVHNSSKPGKKPGFRLHHLSLFFEKTIKEKWKFFSEIEYEDAPKFEGDGVAQPDPAQGDIIKDATGKLFVEAVNITYQFEPNLNIRGGRFLGVGSIIKKKK